MEILIYVESSFVLDIFMKDRVPITNEAFKEWEEKARSELKGNDLSGPNWQTPEGIELKALYTASDLE